MAKKSKELILKIADKREGALIIFAIIFWYLFNDATNIISASPFSMFSIGNLWGTSYIHTVYFVFPMFLFCAILSVALMSRNLWSRKSHNNYDLIVGIVLFLSLLFMGIASTIEMMGGSGTFAIYWIGGLAKATLFHIGVAGFWLSMIYYAVFD